MRQTAERASELKVQSFKIVLLGDIFEILKSRRWIDQNLRPWDAYTTAHKDTVTDIFKSIVDVNHELFDELRNLRHKYSFVEIIYVPGNHDWPFNSEMGVNARSIFVDYLGLCHNPNLQFDQKFIDPHHKTIASHGHERDPFNRYKNGEVALGDVIVVDFLLQLPLQVSSELGISEYDRSISFLHELDNVRPQSPLAMATWLLKGIENFSGDHQEIRVSISRAIVNSLSGLIELRKLVKSKGALRRATWWVKTLKWLAQSLPKSLDLFNIATQLPSDSEHSSYIKFGHQELDLANSANGNDNYEIIVFGHTHIPEHQGLRPGMPSGKASAQIYLNTGTWRRVHQFVSGTGFIEYNEESFVIIFDKNEQLRDDLPRYEFHRLARGRG